MKTLAKAILTIPELNPLPQMVDGGALPALITGLAPIHRAHLAAAMYLETGSPMFIICPDDTAAEAMAANLAAFLELDEVPVLLSRGFALYSSEGVSRSGEQRRLNILFDLARGKTPIAVATVSALLQRTISPIDLISSALEFKLGETMELSSVEEKLIKCGYKRTDQVEGAGQFSRRGGILDFFSPAYPQPVRCEFWGDDIDSMGFFDVQTQRRTENLKSCLVLPAAETLPEHFPGGSQALADLLEDIAAKLSRRSQTKQVMALGSTLKDDADRLRTGLGLNCADRYLCLIHREKTGALSYIPTDAMCFWTSRAR